MKILYVEDELTKNVPRIRSLFSKFIEDKDLIELQDLENDDSGYGISAEEIKEIVERSRIIEVAYTFPMALEKIMNKVDEFSMFIVDRNLLEVPYKLEEVTKIYPDYTEQNDNDHSSREGDFLLQILAIDKQIDIKSKFYFLSAFTDSDIKGCNELQTFIKMFKFKENNFIGKSEDKKLKELINKHELLDIQSKNKVYINILRNSVGNKAVKKLCKIIETKDHHDEIIGNLSEIRKISEKNLKKVALKFEVANGYVDSKGAINYRGFVGWLKNSKKGKDGKNRNDYRLNTSVIIISSLYDIQSICSDEAVHEYLGNRNKGYQPTINTVNSLLYSLKDLILWNGSLQKNIQR